MSSVIIKNPNRAHAVQQLKKALKSINDGDTSVAQVQVLASLANTFIYIADIFAGTEGEYHDVESRDEDIEEVDD